MENFKSKKILVLDTEYDSNPKRLLALAYVIYFYDDNKWQKIKNVRYVKYSSDIFQVDENGESFEFHQLTNDFLQENGEDINEIISDFSNSLDDIDVILGQNVVNADLQLIRKESIGTNNWFDDIRNKIKNMEIYDTMISFRNSKPELKSSLDSIYQFCFKKEMKNHHDALSDCKNTFKCFEYMIENNFEFENQKIKFSEDVFEELTKELPQCDICSNKILEDNVIYKFKNDKVEFPDKKFRIYPNITKKGNKICTRCLGNIELVIESKDDRLINMVKLKTYDSYINEFFDIEGNETITIYLVSSYKDKDEIKKLGGKWDGRKKSWYFSYNNKSKSKLKKFERWIPSSEISNDV